MTAAMLRILGWANILKDSVVQRLYGSDATVLAQIEMDKTEGLTLNAPHPDSPLPASTGDSHWLQFYTYAATGDRVWARLLPPRVKLGTPPPLSFEQCAGVMPPCGEDWAEEALMGPLSDGTVDEDALRALRAFGDVLWCASLWPPSQRLSLPPESTAVH
jgi:hypothetical protein